MVLGFKPHFVDKILSGSKIHTIREDKNQRWKPGNKIHFATGIRTRNYNQFHEGECTSVQDIEIYLINRHGSYHNPMIFVDGVHIVDRDVFAKNDGFENWRELMYWFFPWLSKRRTGPNEYKGRLIHWTNKTY